MKALVIGAGGFAGPYLVKALLQEGYDVLATKLSFENVEVPGCETADLNVTDARQVKEVLSSAQPDVVFHLAAASSVARSWKNIDKTFEINVNGCIHVLDAVRALEKKARILLIGSSEEYGFTAGAKMPVNEEAPIHPANPYAISKYSQTCLGRMYHRAFGTDVVMMRAFNHIGPGQPEGFVVPDFCRQIVQIERGQVPPVIRVGNLSAKRDFTDVRDIMHGYVLCSQHGRAGEVYNIGSGRSVAISEILNQLLSLSHVKISVEIDPSRLRPSDVPEVVADVSKITGDTGWRPRISLEQSLSETLEYWRNKQEQD